MTSQPGLQIIAIHKVEATRQWNLVNKRNIFFQKLCRK